MDNKKYYLLPPPRMLPDGELPAVIEPSLRDLRPLSSPDIIEEWEIFPSKPLENQLTEEMVDQAQRLALADSHIKQLLKDKRYISIGASLRTNKNSDVESYQLKFVFYNYSDNIAIDVFFDETREKIVKVKEVRYQPAPLQQEIEQAIALARKDRRLAERLTDDMEGNAILVSPLNPTARYYSHRQFDVRFGHPDERLPRYNALVDLSTETVIRAGNVCRVCQDNQQRKEVE
ncbi:hypothetical protein [Bacillus cereus group sp. BfR-BA-01313]|uniref:hypothetical protein n=1 Tax=unclassified Bacillus cereus group TaxID=2750818 RepID=UPI001F58E5F3|nr:hypothetical protein [Bacillus cereus]